MVDISFRNITYTLPPKKKSEEEKVILNKVSGVFKGGEVSAIIGASGAGKTTLLNIVACRISKASGELAANSKSYNYDSFGDFANYVMQSDFLMETLTVK